MTLFKKRKGLSGARKTVWAPLVFAILFMPPVFWIVGRNTRRMVLSELKEQADDILHANLAFMKSQFDKFHTITRIVSMDERVITSLEDAGNRGALQGMNTFLARMMGSIDAVSYVMNPQGLVLASSNWGQADSFVGGNYGFRPYFKESIHGNTGRYVAKGVTSGKPGYYVSMPVRRDGRVIGVAVTKCDPNRLVLKNSMNQRDFYVSDENGVVIISGNKHFLYRTVRELPREVRERIEAEKQYPGEKLLPIPFTSVEHLDQVSLLSMDYRRFTDDPTLQEEHIRDFAMISSPVPDTRWTAYALASVGDLGFEVFENCLIAALIMLFTALWMMVWISRWLELKSSHEQALSDPLTGLYTRLYMNDAVNRLLAAHDRGSIPGVCVILFDLDHFKKVNDRYGHLAGDDVLSRVARVIREESRSSDIAVRFGGEELLVFLPTNEIEHVRYLAERVRKRVKALKFRYGNNSFGITISGGIARHEKGEPIEKMIGRADRFLYQAKQTGRNRIMGRKANGKDADEQ
jgi:diguanylate cyclase (GGDEF)-like protein